jgi:hypothetical protein
MPKTRKILARAVTSQNVLGLEGIKFLETMILFRYKRQHVLEASSAEVKNAWSYTFTFS